MAAIAGPLLWVLIAAIIEYPALLLVPAGMIALALAYGIIDAIAERPVAPELDRLLVPPDRLSQPQPVVPPSEPLPTPVPVDGAESPGHGNLTIFPALRRLPARWRHSSPPMRPPAS
jgi:hypothetical protein